MLGKRFNCLMSVNKHVYAIWTDIRCVVFNWETLEDYKLFHKTLKEMYQFSFTNVIKFASFFSSGD
jgi:hypothetical protein